MYLMDQLVLMGNTLAPTDSMYAFADFVYHHFDEVGTYSIEELARACSLSAPTVSRIIKRMGFESYRAFREACRTLARSYRASEHGYDHFALRPENAVEVMGRTIGPALARITEEQLDCYLTYLLPKQGTAYLVGLANMHALALQIQFAIAGFRNHDAIAPSTFEMLDRLRSDDTLIVFSGTGNIFQSTDIAAHLRTCPARRLLVTTTNFDARSLPFHEVIALWSPARQHLVNNYLLQGFSDMALCRAGLYD